MPRSKRRRWSKDYQRYIGQRSFWSRQRKVRRGAEPEVNVEETEEPALMPVSVLETSRRLTGPTTSTATDGLTKEEADEIDLSLFKDEMRWRPYLATMENGEKKLLFRLRPKHWDQRSGGIWLPESSEANYVPPPYTPRGKISLVNRRQWRMLT